MASPLEMYWKNSKLYNSFIVALIEVLFISLLFILASRQYKNFSSAMFVTEVIMDSFCASQHECSIATCGTNHLSEYIDLHSVMAVLLATNDHILCSYTFIFIVVCIKLMKCIVTIWQKIDVEFYLAV